MDSVPYGPGELDIIAQAFHGALAAAAKDGRDAEEIKAVLRTGILDAARGGERDPDRLETAGLNALRLYEDGRMDAVMQSAPL
jgi:hypothetical protein